MTSRWAVEVAPRKEVPATGDEALDLWDHVLGLARCENFFELKRSRTASPPFE